MTTEPLAPATPDLPGLRRPDAPLARAAGGSVGSPQRNASIDVLRGLSIVLVVVHHVGLRIPLRHGGLAHVLPARLLSALTSNGYEAVFVFFVVSGFLITSNALARWGALATIDVGAFYRRRAARILPCLLLLVTILVVLDALRVDHFVVDRARQTSWRAVVAALGLHLNWYEGISGYLPASWDVLWSLSIEEVFYLAFPLVGVMCGRRRWLVPLLVVLAASLPWTHARLDGNEIWQEKAYLPGMAAIATGLLAALLAPRWRPPAGTVAWLRGLGAVGLVAVFGFEDLLWRSLHDGCLLVLTVCVAALLIASSAVPARRRALRGTGWLQSFGRLSYEVYLSHMFAVWCVVDLYRRTGADPFWGFAWYLPALGLSWGLAWLVAHWFSGPALRWMATVGARGRQ